MKRRFWILNDATGERVSSGKSSSKTYPESERLRVEKHRKMPMRIVYPDDARSTHPEYTPEELESITLGERYQFPTKSRSFGRKVYRQLPEKDNDRLRKLARDLAKAKADLVRLKKQKTKPKRKLPKADPEPSAVEKANLLKRSVKYKPNTEFERERLNSILAELNGRKIKVALSNDPDRLTKLAELEEEAIEYRRKRYRLTRPYFSEKLIDFRENHRNGVDTFIHACKSIGMTEREAYTLWHSPK